MTQKLQNKLRLGALIILLLTAAFLSECAEACPGRTFTEQWRNCAIGMEKTEQNLSTLPVELIPYYRKYDALFNPPFYVPARFVSDLKNEPNPNTIGVCDVSKFVFFEPADKQLGIPNLRVEISRDFWESATEGQREQLVFHELGHCLHGLHHYPQTQFTIMTPRLQAPWVYMALRPLFWAELRNKIKSLQFSF